MDIINLYVLKNSNCPKCKILRKKCKDSWYINNSDFQVIEVDPIDPNDSSVFTLVENNIIDMPVLLVNNTFYNFADAMKLISGDVE